MSDESESRQCHLIAMPQLADPNFTQTATLLSEFTKDGAMGVVLNRPLDVTLSKLLGKEVPNQNISPVRVHWGGPVQNELGWIVHEDEALASESMAIAPHLFLSCSPKALDELVARAGQTDGPRFRFFLGYAGWGPGQLEQEIALASWVTAPVNRDLIFDDTPDTLWKRSLAAIGVDPMALASEPQSELH